MSIAKSNEAKTGHNSDSFLNTLGIMDVTPPLREEYKDEEGNMIPV